MPVQWMIPLAVFQPINEAAVAKYTLPNNSQNFSIAPSMCKIIARIRSRYFSNICSVFKMVHFLVH